MHLTPHPRQKRGPRTEEPHESLTRLRRRCIIGAWLSAAVFIGAFVVDLGRRSSGDDVGVLGVEMAATGIGSVCAGSIVLTRALMLAANTRQADELKWAVRLGEDMADVYRIPTARHSGGG